MTLPISASSGLAPPPPQTDQNNSDLRAVAQELEASFLAEMLKHARFGEARGSFGGGAGEDQFASLLRTEHARALAENGGIGLAESIFESLLARQGSGPPGGNR
jgi:Rod binding domain-containing protein